MSDDSKKEDVVELTLPVNAAYVSAARLTASSISNRIGLKIESAEDVKGAVSEACIYVIKFCQSYGENLFKISFVPKDEGLEIVIKTNKNPRTPEDYEGDEFIIRMIEALIDVFEIKIENQAIEIYMLKKF